MIGPDGVPTQAGVDSLGYLPHLPVLWEGTWVSADMRTASCDSPAMLDCYNAYHDLLWKQHVMPRPGEKLVGSGSAFAAGKAAMSVLNSSQISQAAKTLTGVSWGLMPFPKAQRSAYVYNPQMEYIARTSKHTDDTWTYLKWLDEGSRYARFVAIMPMVPADATQWAQEFFKPLGDVRPQVLLDSLKVGLHTDPLLAITGEDVFVPKTVEAGLAAITAGKADVKTTLQQIKPPLQQLVTACACAV